jgi:hypothetical protein
LKKKRKKQDFSVLSRTTVMNRTHTLKVKRNVHLTIDGPDLSIQPINYYCSTDETMVYAPHFVKKSGIFVADTVKQVDNPDEDITVYESASEFRLTNIICEDDAHVVIKNQKNDSNVIGNAVNIKMNDNSKIEMSGVGSIPRISLNMYGAASMVACETMVSDLIVDNKGRGTCSGLIMEPGGTVEGMISGQTVLNVSCIKSIKHNKLKVVPQASFTKTKYEKPAPPPLEVIIPPGMKDGNETESDEEKVTISKKRWTELSEAASKKKRKNVGSGTYYPEGKDEVAKDKGAECVLCKDNKIKTCCQPCGHPLFCFKCAKDYFEEDKKTRKSKGKPTWKCPYCKEPINEIGKLFVFNYDNATEEE